MTAQAAVDLQRRTRKTAWIAAGVALGMLGAAYASVPLYRLFCQLTGFDGTPVRAKGFPSVVGDHQVAVRFNAETSRGMPWIFRPVQKDVTVKVGEPTLIAYRAHNPTNRTITGTASFNVTPEYAAKYFAKVQCFCFTEQTLHPNQTVDMPVSFYVEPSIVDDPDAKHLEAITLSYTFFAMDTAEKKK